MSHAKSLTFVHSGDMFFFLCDPMIPHHAVSAQTVNRPQLKLTYNN
jgi:hypothetical protein